MTLPSNTKITWRLQAQISYGRDSRKIASAALAICRNKNKDTIVQFGSCDGSMEIASNTPVGKPRRQTPKGPAINRCTENTFVRVSIAAAVLSSAPA